MIIYIKLVILYILLINIESNIENKIKNICVFDSNVLIQTAENELFYFDQNEILKI